jgi:cytochrome c biogenesis protein CcdA
VMLGAGIALVELPTAIPYFAAIAVIIGSGVALPGKIVLLVAYNLAFVAPIFAMLVTLLLVGDRARPFLQRANDWMLGHWPGVLASLAGLLGFVIAGLGVAGLLGA